MSSYPKWKYHRTLPPCIVDGPIAEAELGEGWADTPAFFYCVCRPGESCPNCPPAPVLSDPATPDSAAELAASSKPTHRKAEGAAPRKHSGGAS